MPHDFFHRQCEPLKSPFKISKLIQNLGESFDNEIFFVLAEQTSNSQNLHNNHKTLAI